MEKLTEVFARALDMGGYGAFVWPAYAIAMVVMLGMAVLSARSLRRAKQRLAELQSAALSPNE